MIRLIFDEFNEIRRKKLNPENKLVSAKILGTKKIVKQNHDRKNPFVFQEPRHPEDFPEFSIPGSFFSSPGVSVNFCLFVQPVTNEAKDFRSKITFFSVTKKPYFFSSKLIFWRKCEELLADFGPKPTTLEICKKRKRERRLFCGTEAIRPFDVVEVENPINIFQSSVISF